MTENNDNTQEQEVVTGEMVQAQLDALAQSNPPQEEIDKKLLERVQELKILVSIFVAVEANPAATDYNHCLHYLRNLHQLKMQIALAHPQAMLVKDLKDIVDAAKEQEKA